MTDNHPGPRHLARFAGFAAGAVLVAIAFAIIAAPTGRSPLAALAADPAPQCSTQFDIMLVLDESGSIDATEFAQEKSFAVSIANSFNFGPTATQMGVAMFATNARVAVALTSNKTAAINGINGIAPLGGGTDIAAGLALAQSTLDTNGRVGVQDVLVLVTDGQHNGAGDPVAVAAAARAQGTDIFAVGVGNYVLTELQGITGDNAQVFTVAAFSQLSSLVNALIAGVCPGFGTSTPTGTPTPTPDCSVQMSPPEGCPTWTPTPTPDFATYTPTPTNTPCDGACPPTATPDCNSPPVSPPVAGCPTFTPTATPTPACNTSPPEAGCADTDGDFWPDNGDNCPGIANNDQDNTDAANTNANRPGADAFGDACDGDIDGDGYTNTQETSLITGAENPTLYCNIMRADLDGDRAVSILDLTLAANKFTQTIPPAPDRYRQDADLTISILDLTRMANVFTQNVSACP